jgi:hypothetical protein
VAGVAVAPLAIASSGLEHHVHADSAASLRIFHVPVQFLTGIQWQPWDITTDTAVRLVAAVALCCLGIGLVATRASRRERRAAAVIGGFAAVVSVVPSAVGLVLPRFDYISPAYVIAALLPLLIVVAIGLTTRRAGTAGAVAAAALAGVMLSMTISIAARSELQRPDWRGLTRAIGPPHGPRAVVADGSLPVSFYLPHVVQGTVLSNPWLHDRLLRYLPQWSKPAAVDEIALVGRGPRPPLEELSLGATGVVFHEVSTKHVGDAAVTVYSGSRGVEVGPTGLVPVAAEAFGHGPVRGQPEFAFLQARR